MIIVCKNCKASFLVPASTFSGGARNVRCSKCGTTWKESTPGKPPLTPPAVKPAHVAAAPYEPPAREPQEPLIFKQPPQTNKQRAGNLAKLAAIAVLIAFVISLCVGTIFLTGHSFIIAQWPDTQRLYVMLGLAKDPLKDNLFLQNISSERRYVDGAMQLVVQGEIRSGATKRQVVPAISVEALGPDGRIIESWRIEAPKATMDPGTLVPFSSSIISPEGTVVEVNLSFVEPPHDEP